MGGRGADFEKVKRAGAPRESVEYKAAIAVVEERKKLQKKTDETWDAMQANRNTKTERDYKPAMTYLRDHKDTYSWSTKKRNTLNRVLGYDQFA
ncbi:MAG: hypothetical protein Q4P08_06240 [Eubacteriales bacterium]|nr:hypothetical protein [Eubacteriales bacterium]